MTLDLAKNLQIGHQKHKQQKKKLISWAVSKWKAFAYQESENTTCTKEENISGYRTDNGLEYRTLKIQQQKEKKLKWAKDLNKYFSKENIQISKSAWKDVQHH